MLLDIVDKAKQAVDPLTHLIQALRHLDQPIFGFAKTSDSGLYKQTDPYGFCGYLRPQAQAAMSRLMRTASMDIKLSNNYRESQNHYIVLPALI